MEQFPQKFTNYLFHILSNWENTYLKKGRYILTIKSTPNTELYRVGWRGDSNSQLLSEERKVWTTQLVPQLLRLSPKACSLKSFSWKPMRLAFMGPTIANKDSIWPWLSPQSSMHREQARTPVLVFLCKGFGCILYKLLPEDLTFD